MKYLLGGSEFWLGRTMKDSHKHLKISEDQFDIYYKAFTATLRQIKTSVKIMQVLTKKVNELRDEIISSGEPEIEEK
jgi:truncated hemoglobin YjbI